MEQKENTREHLEQTEPELAEQAEPIPVRDDPEYVERPKSTRVLAMVLAIIMIIGVILYYLWIAGILHT